MDSVLIAYPEIHTGKFCKHLFINSNVFINQCFRITFRRLMLSTMKLKDLRKSYWLGTEVLRLKKIADSGTLPRGLCFSASGRFIKAAVALQCPLFLEGKLGK